MRHEELMCALFNFSAPTYYKRKKEGNLAIKLIEQYLSDCEIKEYLEHEYIIKLDDVKRIANQSETILRKFFFEYYVNKPININFANYIFPEFEKYINTLINKRQENYINIDISDSKSEFITKSNFFDFLINSDIDRNSKTSTIETISVLSELEFFIIMTRYKNYLENSAHRKDFFK